uniref:Uncharacterized protein n=1 Tax=Anguilla anguilla TaxID=7936 RepID=A0A0E9X6W8_ANGAN
MSSAFSDDILRLLRQYFMCSSQTYSTTCNCQIELHFYLSNHCDFIISELRYNHDDLCFGNIGGNKWSFL